MNNIIEQYFDWSSYMGTQTTSMGPRYMTRMTKMLLKMLHKLLYFYVSKRELFPTGSHQRVAYYVRGFRI